MSSNKAARDSRSLPSEAVVLDVPFLDEFFLDWVLDRLRRILQSLQRDHTGVNAVTTVILQFLRPFTQCLILLTTHAQTPATRLLGLQRVPREGTSSSSPRQALTRRDYYFRLVAYALFSTILPVLYGELKEWHRQRLRERLAHHDHSNHRVPEEEEEPAQQSSRRQEQLAAERKFQCTHYLIHFMTRAWPMLRLAALLGVWTGWSQTSEVAMILSGWTYQKRHQQDQGDPRLHVDYAQRRWIWEELVRSIRVWGQGLTLLSVWRHDLDGWKDHLMGSLFQHGVLRATNEPADAAESSALLSCAFCHAKPIIIPFRLHPCGHAVCYACFHQRSSKASVRCRLCKQPVVHATVWSMRQSRELLKAPS